MAPRLRENPSVAAAGPCGAGGPSAPCPVPPSAPGGSRGAHEQGTEGWAQAEAGRRGSARSSGWGQAGS